MIICEELFVRLLRVWSRLQAYENKRCGYINQYCLDTVCIERLEAILDHLERGGECP